MPIITSASIITPTTVTATSTLAGYSASNATDYRRPSLPWRATDNVSGSTRLTYDLGAAQTVAAVVLDSVNVSPLTVQSSTDNSTWTTQFNAPVAVDTRDGRRKVYAAISNISARYWRVQSSSSLTDDGSGQFSIGSFILLSSAQEWAANPGFPLDIDHRRAIIANDDFASGAREPIAIGNRHVRITMSASNMPPTMKSTIDTVIGSYGEHTPWVLYLNAGNNAEVYVVHRVGSVTWSQQGPNHWELSSFVVQEVQ